MRIDGQQFINFNDFHVPFTDYDLFVLKTSIEQGDLFKHNFGAIGSGMQDAVSISTDDILEHASSAQSEDEAIYNLSTLIDATDNPISGEEIHEIYMEAQETGKSFALIAQKRLKHRAIVQTIVAPADSVPDIAFRTENKPR